MQYLLILMLLLFGSSKPSQQLCPNPLLDSVAVVTCISVADGDTWKFAIGRDTFSVRVLNLDCFETRRGERLRNQAEAHNISEDSALALGKAAKQLAISLLVNKEVKIVRDYDESNFDFYNRLLRHCWLDDTTNYTSYFQE